METLSSISISSGSDIEPDEIDMLEKVATTAGVAFEHLEFKRLEKELEAVRRQLQSATSA